MQLILFLSPLEAAHGEGDRAGCREAFEHLALGGGLWTISSHIGVDIMKVVMELCGVQEGDCPSALALPHSRLPTAPVSMELFQL